MWPREGLEGSAVREPIMELLSRGKVPEIRRIELRA